MRPHDNAETRTHFGEKIYSSGAIASYPDIRDPQVRGVTLNALFTQIVDGATFSTYGTNQMRHAQQLIEAAPNDTITAFDRGLLSAEILYASTRGDSERRFIIPAKPNTCWEVIKGDEDGNDFKVRRRVSNALSCRSFGRRVPLPSLISRGANVPY